MSRRGLLLLAASPIFFALAANAFAEPRQTVDFDRDIRPILADTCYTCHGPDDATRQADLRLDRRESALAERDGRHIVAPGEPEESELLRRVTSNDEFERMPPPESNRQLTSSQIDLLKRWIAEGAEWPEDRHWAFTAPRRPPLPAVNDAPWARNEIDRFVLARLELEGLSPSEEASRSSLIRRVTLDLTGLPPTIAEIDAFLADTAPGAYERLVDRLLASPRYGEHMAAAWLDAARYADTDGYQNDRLRDMWVWRDWVIKSLNENLPFDDFTVQQLAGDLLPDATLYQQIATGFNRNHRINSEAGSISEEWRVEYVVDRVDTLGTVWLGLTVGCARCHDHKYDPLSHREYYQLYAFFNNVPEWGVGPNNGNSPPYVKVPESWPNLSPEENHAREPAPIGLKTDKRFKGLQRPTPGGDDTVMVMAEMDEPRDTHLLLRGQWNQPDASEILQPQTPRVLGALPQDSPPNRLGLARWLVDPEHPLTARVTVNRYWQHFFGAGLVKTSDNFGVQGDYPSHPKLLDWLATEFIRRDWDVKAMHRLIVTSAAYKQASRVSPELLERDPENRLLARGPRVRLSGPMLRDQALAVSGLLAEQIGGPSVKPYMPPGIWKSISNAKYKQDHGAKLYRRGLYTYWRRTTPPPTMLTFNAAKRDVCIVYKDQTNTPLQALTLMNNVAFVEAARLMAERMLARPGELENQLAYGFRLATARHPASEERKLLRQAFERFLEQFRDDPSAAQALLAVGEYPYDSKLEEHRLAAMTMLASAILNFDESIVKE